MAADAGLKVGQAHHLVDASAHEFVAQPLGLLVKHDIRFAREHGDNVAHLTRIQLAIVFDEDDVRITVEGAKVVDPVMCEAEDMPLDIINHNIFKVAQGLKTVRDDKTVENLRHLPL